MNNIVLVGSGNIGSRHLQAFANLTQATSISVIDASRQSLETAKSRWTDALNGRSFSGQVSFNTTLHQIPSKVDVAIIATDSASRRQAFEQLIASSQVKNIVFEKFLFQRKIDFTVVAEALEQQQIRAWVNCARRMVPFYQELKTLLAQEKKIDFTVSGSNWGLGCNGIHFLDMFAWFSGSTELSLSGDLLDASILPSKRAGYVEFTGTIKGMDTNGNSVSISSLLEPSQGIQIQLKTEHWIIDIEENGEKSKAVVFHKATEKQEIKNFRIPYQSEQSNKFVEAILSSGDCPLTGFKESAELHQNLLNVYIAHMEKQQNRKVEFCPIT